MIISKPVQQAFITGSSSRNTEVPPWDSYGPNNTFVTDKLYGSGGRSTSTFDTSGVFMWTQPALTVPDYDAGADGSYVRGDLTYDALVADKMAVCVGIAGEVVQEQPNEYSNTSVQLNLGSMSGRYACVHYSSPGNAAEYAEPNFEFSNGDAFYRVYRDFNSSTHWKFTIRWKEGSEDKAFTTECYVYDYIHDGLPEPQAFVVGDDPDTDWVGKSFFVDNNRLWMRTDKSINADKVSGVTSTWADMWWLDNINGFTFYRATNNFRQYDGKAYTVFESPITSIGFRVDNVDAPFDVLALTGVTGHEVNAIFRDSSGSTLDDVTVAIDSSIDSTGDAIGGTTTVIIYSDTVVPPGGYVFFSIKNNTGDILRLSDVTIGKSIEAGFTNLSFNNKTIDFSPREQDQWGNIVYVDSNVRSDVFSGSVDVKIEDYDKVNRLFKVLAGHKMIFDGSDSSNNIAANGSTNFAATKVVGRMKDVQMSTVVEDQQFSPVANYTFTIEGSV